jgi:hypothetical protein
MTLRPTLIAAIAAFAACALPAFAQTPAPAPAASASFTVPPHNCVAPPYPSRAETTRLRGDQYNKVIETFNENYKAYGECIKKYVADTNVWAKAVTDSGNKAIDEYNKYTSELKEKLEAEKQ